MSTRTRLLLGLAPAVGFLALLFFLFVRSDYRKWLEALSDANYAWVLPAAITYFASFYFRSLRWRFLLRPFADTTTARLYPVVIVGYMANNLLPLRAGEVVRSYYLSRREQVNTATALATIVVERVFDGVLMLLLLLAGVLFLPFSGLPEGVRDAVAIPVWAAAVIMAAPFILGLAVIIMAALRPGLFEGMGNGVARRIPLPMRYRALLRAFVSRFVGGFAGLHQPGRLAKVAALTLPVWTMEGITYYLIALGFDLDAHLGSHWLLAGSMLLIISLANLAISVPLSQGGVGPFEIFAALGLVVLGVGSVDASAYAIVLHAVLLLPVIVVGLLYLAVRSIPLGELLQSRAESTPKGAP
ncbi:MAG: lysylphosphatidylglycerol synthase transmembrane domain-containing protein [Chloroflexota bacterium]|nr:lysylphosphatidylglycerol synthase transmembrane domain-containing protein [Chloroflexota bacterium]MDE2885998.1 lysylphosphatidylglycerol synthase transmembrane domain-containing protein [Chloroflexota bacterium]